ncbi:MAG: hypothetical protein HKN47_18130 [Pirellulaceae bacterium]|nr:hypothetical protein [Pirellulaceae bacterium]
MTDRTANHILDETFLEIRAKLLEIAADFDRMDRAADDGESMSGVSNERREKLSEAVRLLLSEGPDRAERLQKLFSREYESQWRSEMQI